MDDPFLDLVAKPGAGGSAPNVNPFVTLRTRRGVPYTVNVAVADQFRGLLNDLEDAGYDIKSVGGVADRNVAGTNRPSYHKQGLAIDINPTENPVGAAGDLPPTVGEIAARHGLGWGGNWKSKKDPMHFSAASQEGGSLDITREGVLRQKAPPPADPFEDILTAAPAAPAAPAARAAPAPVDPFLDIDPAPWSGGAGRTTGVKDDALGFAAAGRMALAGGPQVTAPPPPTKPTPAQAKAIAATDLDVTSMSPALSGIGHGIDWLAGQPPGTTAAAFRSAGMTALSDMGQGVTTDLPNVLASKVANMILPPTTGAQVTALRSVAPFTPPAGLTRMAAEGKALMPPPGLATTTGTAGGGLAPYLLSGAAGPGAPYVAAGMMAASGAHAEAEKAAEMGLTGTPEAANAIGANALWQGATGFVPFGFMSRFAPEARGAVSEFLQRSGFNLATGAATGATMGIGQNLVERATIDPTQPLGKGVLDQTGQMAAISFLMGLLHMPPAQQVAAIKRASDVTGEEPPPPGAPPGPPGAPPGEPPGGPPAGPPGGPPRVSILPRHEALASYRPGEPPPPPPPGSPVVAPTAEAGVPPIPPGPPVTPVEAVTGKKPRVPPPRMTPEIAAEIEQHTAGAPPDVVAGAQADVKRSNTPTTAAMGRELLDEIISLGGMRTKDLAGNRYPAGPDVQAALQDVKRPGLWNNGKRGKTPEQMMDALRDRGWFGVNAPTEGLAPDYTNTFTDMLSSAKRVYHPESERGQIEAHRTAIDEEMLAAGIPGTDHPDLQAAKLARIRHEQRLQEIMAADHAGLDAHEQDVYEGLTPEDQAQRDAEFDTSFASGSSLAEQTPAPAHREAPAGHVFEPRGTEDVFGAPVQAVGHREAPAGAGAEGVAQTPAKGTPEFNRLINPLIAERQKHEDKARSLRHRAIRQAQKRTQELLGETDWKKQLAHPLFHETHQRMQDEEAAKVYEEQAKHEQLAEAYRKQIEQLDPTRVNRAPPLPRDWDGKPLTGDFALVHELGRTGDIEMLKEAHAAAVKDRKPAVAQYAAEVLERFGEKPLQTPPAEPLPKQDQLAIARMARGVTKGHLEAIDRDINAAALADTRAENPHPRGNLAAPGNTAWRKSDQAIYERKQAEHRARRQSEIDALTTKLARQDEALKALEAKGKAAAEKAGVPKPEPVTEKEKLAGGETVEQAVIPGSEASAKQAAQARGEGGIKAKVPQREPGGLFAPPEPPQEDLFAAGVPPKEGPPPTPERKPYKPPPTGHEAYDEAERREPGGDVRAETWRAGFADGALGKGAHRYIPSGMDTGVYHDGREAGVQWVREGATPSPEPAAPPAPAAEPPAAVKRPSDWGDKNKIVTKDQAAAIRARMLARNRNTLRSGLSDEDIADGTRLAVFHLEAGARKFADFAKAMLEDLGEWARPYLRSWYEGARHWPGNEAAARDMTPPHEVADVLDQLPHLERGGQVGAPEQPPGEGPVPPVAGGAERGPGEAGGGLEGAGRAEPGGDQLPDRGAPVVGEPSDLGLRAEPPGAGAGAAERGEPVRGDTPGDYGVQPDRGGPGDLEKAAGDAAHVEPVSQDAGPKTDLSVDAPPVPSDIEADLPTLFPAQRGDVAFAEQRFDHPDGHGVVFTNGTGTGKTFTGAGIIKRFFKKGKKNVLIVAPSQGILDQWAEVLQEKFGLTLHPLESTTAAGPKNAIVGTTYANLGANFHVGTRPWDLVVSDEAQTLSSDAEGNATVFLEHLRGITGHPDGKAMWADMQEPDAARNVEELRRAADKERQPGAATHRYNLARKALDELVAPHLARFASQPRSKTVFLSATPFAYDKNVEWGQGYLFDWGPKPTSNDYNAPKSAKDAFFIRHFGYRMRTGKLTKPEDAVQSTVMERQFHQWMRQQGFLSGRVSDVPLDYDRKFLSVESGVGRRIDQAMEFLRKADGGKYQPLARVIEKRFAYLQRLRLLEAIKAQAAIEHIQQHLALGRKVAVYHQYIEGGGFSPFVYDEAMEREMAANEGVGLDAKALHDAFMAANPYVEQMNTDWGDLKSPIETLSAAFPDALTYNGTMSDKAKRQAKTLFNTDGSGHDVMIVQADAGNSGLSLHDTTGKHQRVMMNLGMMGKPTINLQIEGRIARLGMKTNALFRYFNTGTAWERFAFADRIAGRSGTAENLAMGEDARNIREAFVDAYEDSGDYRAAHGEGVGGKARDFERAQAVTDFERAKSYYWAQQKNAKARAQREGKDYYATPEPLGQKMVEWANMQPGEHALEPSAGHGAIARWMPETNSRTLIEPSAELASRAALAAPDAHVREMRFEDLHSNQKYNSIVMNPPFGHAGADAITHVAKALVHVRNGGRVVALVPEGRAVEGVRELLAGDQLKGAFHTVAEIKLPESTFERAGTKVRSRIFVIEKQVDPEVGRGIETQHIDVSGASSTKALFDRIEHLTLPDRLQPRTVEAAPPPEGAVAGTEAKADFSTAEHPPWQEGAAPVFSATPETRTSREVFSARNEIARRYGGRYMSKDAWAGHQPPRPHGWYFDRPQDRDAFLNEVRTGQATAVERPKTSFALGETRHGKTGEPLFVATASERVDPGEFQRVSGLAKAHGGFYSSFRGRGAIPGYQFKSAKDREAFVKAVNGEAPGGKPGVPPDIAEAQAEINAILSGRQIGAGVDPTPFVKVGAHYAKEGATWLLGKGVNKAGEWLQAKTKQYMPEGTDEFVEEARKAVIPLEAGGEIGKVESKVLANARRRVWDEWTRVHNVLTRSFRKPELEAMWNALDEQSVLDQQGQTAGPNEGLNRLSPEQRDVAEELDARAQKAIAEAHSLGMIKSLGLPHWTPRMLVAMTAEGPRKLLGAKASRMFSEDGQLRTTTPSLRHRKYLTAAETEAAGKRIDPNAVLVRDIRVMALALRDLEDAIAGARMVNAIKNHTDTLGRSMVQVGGTVDPERFTTWDTPALKRWKIDHFVTDPATGKRVPAKDQEGKVMFKQVPVFIDKAEFEGPLRAVLQQPSGKLFRGYMTLKSKAMSAIMFSPLIHNAVIWGKAIPANPVKVFTGVAYFDGYKAKTDEAFRNRMLDAGIAPAGNRGQRGADLMEIAGGVNTNDAPSWSGWAVSRMPWLFDKTFGTKSAPAVRDAIDTFWRHWHNTFLWDRVEDLQFAIAKYVSESAEKEGLPQAAADKLGAHYANLYAGSLPREAMSKGARVLADITLFSRNFTLGNLGAWKALATGLPREVQAQVRQQFGDDVLHKTQGIARRKAIGMLTMDVGLNYVFGALSALAVAGVYKYLLNNPNWKVQYPWQNEPGKESRVLFGFKNGRGLYFRFPGGKVGEELQNWITKPSATSHAKESPMASAIDAVWHNDGGFGKQVWQPGDNLAANAGRVIWEVMSHQLPEGQIQGVHDIVTGDSDRGIAAAQVLAPLAGITISRGHPAGPAGGVLAEAQARHDFEVTHAMPGIRAKIFKGDKAGARADMRALGIKDPRQQMAIIRGVEHPESKLAPKKLRRPLGYMTPDERAQFESFRSEARSRARVP